jgi:hypothetical protein
MAREIELYGLDVNLNFLDVSSLTDLSSLMAINPLRYFNGDISQWDVSNVTDMRHMFQMCPFNGDISKWNTASVDDVAYMFSDSLFSGDISAWNLINATSAEYAFHSSAFCSNLPAMGNALMWYEKMVAPNYSGFIFNLRLDEAHLIELFGKNKLDTRLQHEFEQTGVLSYSHMLRGMKKGSRCKWFTTEQKTLLEIQLPVMDGLGLSVDEKAAIDLYFQEKRWAPAIIIERISYGTYHPSKK